MEAPEPFTHTLIVGYHEAELAFIEPMVTTETLRAQEAFSYELPPPEVLPAGLWPTEIRGSYDATTDTYDFVFEAFL